MYRNLFFSIVALFFMGSTLSAKTEMLFYCGTTMVPAMKALVKEFERNRNCKIRIYQGASGQLLRTLKLSKKGDLFLPGSDAYYQKSDADLFPYRKIIGRNRLTLFVRQGNPLKIRSIEDLFDKRVLFAIGNPQLGSIGKASREMISKTRGPLYWKRMELWAVLYGSDSRDLLGLMLHEGIQSTLNWEAAAFHIPNRSFLEIIPLPEAKAYRKKLILSTLSFSKHPKIARAFVDFAASTTGQKILQQYGLSDE
ncbi:substrate-binding domain-containing protein [Nitratifractor sp.]